MLRGVLIASSLAVALAGCAGRSMIEDTPPDAGPAFDAAAYADVDTGPPPAPRSDKLDLLLVVDNSKNLDLAHALLADTVPYLLDRLTRPACVNGLGNVVDGASGPTDECETGRRDFAPLTDIHIGVISTSLGGHGADICSPQSGAFNPTQDDAAHLLDRGPSGIVPTYDGKGFLAWDPGQTKVPPGDADITSVASRLADLVRGTGTSGCGFESQLESFYRFLIDPNPHASISIEDGAAVLVGSDEVLLKQRSDFLRPDSAVAVVLLTDENDCSTREGGQYFLSNQGLDQNGQAFHLPRPRSECALSPDDPCCSTCGQAQPPGCSPSELDPSCQLPPMDAIEDPVNLRCFDQKRRFGVDFLYPIERYVRGLTEPFVADRDGNVVENPLFLGGRDPSLVHFAGIVGVPWQDIAADPKAVASGFLPPHQIDWLLLLGDPETGDPPFDPLMIESIEPREGFHPSTGAPLAPPTGGQLENPVNGHERALANKDDLQLACIYPRATPKDCAVNAMDCECVGGNIDLNPVCQGPDGAYSTVQWFARALPSSRVLSALQRVGQQGVVASVCAPVTSDPTQPAFGYKPAVDALLRSLRRSLREAESETKGD
jgi:hypothetical protein